jgi:HEAT repeat protein
MQIEDEQWVVRNAAVQALEDIKNPNPRIPQILPPPHQIPWLIAYAGKQGIGVSPGKPVLGLLTSALHSHDQKDLLSALFILSYQDEADTAADLFHLYRTADQDVQDAAYNALWLKAATGVPLQIPA